MNWLASAKRRTKQANPFKGKRKMHINSSSSENDYSVRPVLPSFPTRQNTNEAVGPMAAAFYARSQRVGSRDVHNFQRYTKESKNSFRADSDVDMEGEFSSTTVLTPGSTQSLLRYNPIYPL